MSGVRKVSAQLRPFLLKINLHWLRSKTEIQVIIALKISIYYKMRFRYFKMVLFSTWLLACNKGKSVESIILTGEISGEVIYTIYLEKNFYGEKLPKYSIPVSKNAVFADTLDLSLGYYGLTVGSNNYTIFIEPNSDLKLNIDLSNDSISFEGRGKKENDYLQHKSRLRNKTFYVDYYKYFATLGENEFLKTHDSIRSLYLDLLNQSKLHNKKFVELETKSILVDRVYNLMQYEITIRLLSKQKGFTVSASFPNSEELLDINDDSFLEIPFFTVLLGNNMYYFLKDKVELDTSSDKLRCVDCDLFTEYLIEMGSSIKNENIRNATIFFIAELTLGKAESINNFYSAYKLYNTSTKNEKYIASLYKNLTSKRGRDFLMNAPLKDKNDVPLTLIDFKGKNLYLDFWSASCSPCIKEFPHFNELSQEFKGQNIEFIGINIMDTKEQWFKTIDKNDLQGVQLAVGSSSKFLDSLGVNGIPRYMLVDDMGNVLNFNAKRPSDIEIRKKLYSLIEN